MFLLLFIFAKCVSSQIIPGLDEIVAESSLILYLNPLDDVNISVFNLSTYFSNWKRYLSLNVDVKNLDNTVKTYGPIESKSNLIGINMMKEYVLRFVYDGQDPIKFALIFSKNFDLTHEQTKFADFKFPIFKKFKTQKDLDDFGEFIYPDSIKLDYVAIIMPAVTFILLILFTFLCNFDICY